jgi:hypothetical protein
MRGPSSPLPQRTTTGSVVSVVVFLLLFTWLDGWAGLASLLASG